MVMIKQNRRDAITRHDIWKYARIYEDTFICKSSSPWNIYIFPLSRNNQFVLETPNLRFDIVSTSSTVFLNLSEFQPVFGFEMLCESCVNCSVRNTCDVLSKIIEDIYIYINMYMYYIFEVKIKKKIVAIITTQKIIPYENKNLISLFEILRIIKKFYLPD